MRNDTQKEVKMQDLASWIAEKRRLASGDKRDLNELQQEGLINFTASLSSTRGDMIDGYLALVDEIREAFPMSLSAIEERDKRIAELERAANPGDCYCVCHSSFSSRPACEHCNGINQVSDTRLRKRISELEATLKAREERLGDLERVLPCGHPANGNEVGESCIRCTYRELSTDYEERIADLERQLMDMRTCVQRHLPDAPVFDLLAEIQEGISARQRISELERQLAEALLRGRVR